jgi:hypothetical protein
MWQSLLQVVAFMRTLAHLLAVLLSGRRARTVVTVFGFWGVGWTSQDGSESFPFGVRFREEPRPPNPFFTS